MLVIMLDPCFKNMKNIRDFMGNVRVVKIVVEYDVKMVCLFFVIGPRALKHPYWGNDKGSIG